MCIYVFSALKTDWSNEKCTSLNRSILHYGDHHIYGTFRHCLGNYKSQVNAPIHSHSCLPSGRYSLFTGHLLPERKATPLVQVSFRLNGLFLGSSASKLHKNRQMLCPSW